MIKSKKVNLTLTDKKQYLYCNVDYFSFYYMLEKLYYNISAYLSINILNGELP